MRSITSSARDAFRSLLHSFRTSTSLHGGRATKLYGGGLPSFLILCAQERAVRGTHLGPSCTRPDHIPIRTEATLPNCTVVAFLFNIMRSRTSSARDGFRSLFTQPDPIPVRTEATLPNCKGACHPDDEPSRNIWRSGGDGETSTTLYGACQPEAGP